MARPREFDIDMAVKKAMNVFWERGYNGTSLPDLLDGMGIARGSLYKAFGSKKNLFLQTLDLYDREHVKPAVVMLSDKTIPGEERIARVFDSAVKSAGDGDRRGCLLCNTAAGAASEDPEIADVVNDQLDRLTKAFAVALTDTATQVQTSMTEQLAQANSLTLNYVGLRVMVRSGHKIDALKSGARQTLAKLT